MENENLPQFRVYQANDSSFELTNDTTVKYHRKMLAKDESTRVRQIYLCDVNMPSGEKTELIYIPELNTYKDDEFSDTMPTHIPAWLKKEQKRDKHEWRKIHKAFQKTKKYAPEFFEPLPDVAPTEKKYT